jgi:hypothetical protein
VEVVHASMDAVKIVEMATTVLVVEILSTPI